ncbi:hypothetical protein I6G82_09555 [Lysinibacillus macroides]|uniref:IPT/TIG domain-containing protein n=1 Tax=Lysinibacillus macroides TaxID=33935 RepID=A0A0M9DFW3_9BACI|nr:IPT/TIG domain-containing protein [Lysinibacillus macroides]KOY80658.1 hypothetical protein ADM90_15790 [Lysinibacillus macroides]QPR69797.1 hypothetical protein I6G82_09555 [Lysinibacillus macroides]
MMKRYTIVFSALLLLLLVGCSDKEEKSTGDKKDTQQKEVALQGTLNLSADKGRIGDEVKLTAESLMPNEPLTVVWTDMIGKYEMEENYSFIGTTYEPNDQELLTAQADSNGKWEGTITIPQGFGDDHDILIHQKDTVVAKANYFVETVFTMSPESGPIGTEITIKGEGLSWKMYGSLWHLNYDNKYTGMITGVSTKGSATAVIRATGNKGDHSITIESGSSGSPYLNRSESAINYIHTENFTFNVTNEQPITVESYVEEAPTAAGGGIELDPPKNKKGVTVSLNKEEGIVGEEVTLTANGLPKNENVSIDWHTMVGNRVSAAGYGEKVNTLEKSLKTDAEGSLTYTFAIPDDLGGLPHLIDVKVKDEVYGQTALRILPSIVSITPSSGPVGTKFVVEIKGSGWTEFDNALAVTYDNSYVGYICGFNSQGTIKLPLVATGDTGHRAIDIYPSIYKGQQIQPNLYLNPQLTYRDDHPGTGIPALRMYFEVTE